jgi:hypothetical protein
MTKGHERASLIVYLQVHGASHLMRDPYTGASHAMHEHADLSRLEQVMERRWGALMRTLWDHPDHRRRLVRLWLLYTQAMDAYEAARAHAAAACRAGSGETISRSESRYPAREERTDHDA